MLDRPTSDMLSIFNIEVVFFFIFVSNQYLQGNPLIIFAGNRKLEFFDCSVFAFCLANSLMASGLLLTSGLDDPEVRSPFMISTIHCNEINPKNIFDYSRSYLHFHLALGQSIKKAENSATNAVLSHQQARLQTCNEKAKAVTNGSGHAVRDGNGNIVINVP